MEIQQSLIEERWNAQQIILAEFKLCLSEIPEGETKLQLEKYWAPYIEYINSTKDFETPILKPWLAEDLNSEEYTPAWKIETTTDPETIQLLTWLVKTKKPKIIWEIGCWVGHTTVRLAIAGGPDTKIFACDAFKWQKWMEQYLEMFRAIKPGDSFLNRFNLLTENYSKQITPVEWPYDISKLPNELVENPSPDLVFIDMTQEDSDLEQIWSLTSPYFVADSTVLVFNGLNRSSLPFLTRHGDQLRPLAKPRSIAKAFLFVHPRIPTSEKPYFQVLSRKLYFHLAPNWNHHHNNAFRASIDLLRAELHDDTATTLFIPAVEETLCDNPELLIRQPWIGIIHSVVRHPEQFYIPDLERLCAPAYEKAMERCIGLFTLTQFQAKYLRENFHCKSKVAIPIQPLTYPILNSNNSTSEILNMWTTGERINLLLVGSFARDYELFYNCKILSHLQKVVLTGDWVGELGSKGAPQDVEILQRLDDKEYELALRKSIIFLPLKYEGAANTIILECIDRNIPIVVPAMSSCLEYIGEDYPLQYDHQDKEFDFVNLITEENVRRTVRYLESMDKSKFQPEKFLQTVKNSSVLLAASPPCQNEGSARFDVTISICSYKRTHNLAKILSELWKGQDFEGRVQIIVWNNNEARSRVVDDICADYLRRSTSQKSLEVISSSTNYFCIIRQALPALMKSEALLICDDDIIPGPNFISFFMEAHGKNPNDVLCLRGHVFLPHKLDLENPTNAWMNYEGLRFKSDDAPEQLIHFVHADACLIPRMGLRECASIDMPDPAFDLVDDYWLGFQLNHKFKRNLRKLTTSGLKIPLIERTDDSDTIGLALHTRPEVQDARVRLYLHHMLQGWPSWPEILTVEQQRVLMEEKKQFWTKPFIGFNVSSRINKDDVRSLIKLGIQCVRIGAVGSNGVAPGFAFEFSEFVEDREGALEKLKQTIHLLENYGISVVITLHRDLATALTWKFIAAGLSGYKSVIGYDLINEPFTNAETKMHCTELKELHPNGIPVEIRIYVDMIQSIREVDSATPILIEPTFWAHIDAIPLIPTKLLEMDSNLIVSFHFYEPRLLTQRCLNKNGKFKFPGEVSIYKHKWSETVNWNQELIKQKLIDVQDWAEHVGGGVKLNVGEIGICRDIETGDEYLRSVLNTCLEIGLSGFLFSWRDDCWEAMNYEFGPDSNNFQILPEENNTFLKVIRECVSKMKAES